MLPTNHQFTPTEIANAVTGIFAHGKEDELIKATPMAFTLSAKTDPIQAYRALTSVMYGLYSDAVSLQYLPKDEPLAGSAREGSQEAQDHGLPGQGGTPDAREEERLDLMIALCEMIAAVGAYLKWLEPACAEALEKAGRKSQDGGQFKLEGLGRGFNAYCPNWETYVKDSLARTVKKDSAWAKRLRLAEENIGIPEVDTEDSIKKVRKFFTASNADKTSHKAWTNLVISMAKAGEAENQYKAEMEAYNNSGQTPDDKALFAECGRGRTAARRTAMFYYEIYTAPWELLRHTGVPTWLTESPEWDTHMALKREREAKNRARTAEARAATVMAKTAELKAKQAEFIANNALMEADEALAEQAAEFKAMRARAKQGLPLVEAAPTKASVSLANLPRFSKPGEASTASTKQ